VQRMRKRANVKLLVDYLPMVLSVEPPLLQDNSGWYVKVVLDDGDNEVIHTTTCYGERQGQFGPRRLAVLAAQNWCSQHGFNITKGSSDVLV
jgi:hypothetical protein